MLSALKGTAAACAGFLVSTLAAWAVDKCWIDPDLRIARISQLDAEIAKIDETVELAEKVARKRFLFCSHDGGEQGAIEMRECEVALRELKAQGASADKINEWERKLEISREKAKVSQVETFGDVFEGLYSDIKTLKQRLADLQMERDSLAR